jgi:hypothetical protein
MKTRRGSLAFALLLIVLGGWFLAVEFFPNLKEFAYGAQTWPLGIVGIGAAFAFFALVTWTPGLLIPACIISGIGGMLYYQNYTQNWESWSYSWALIPAFVGVGLILYGLLERRRGAILGGIFNLFGSFLMFSVFSYAFAHMDVGVKFWPVGLILLGVLFLTGMLRDRPVRP